MGAGTQAVREELISRLTHAGATIAQRQLTKFQDSFDDVGYGSREKGLLKAFRALDTDGTGYLDNGKLRAISSAASPCTSHEQVWAQLNALLRVKERYSRT